jgi:hypothetical protein
LKLFFQLTSMPVGVEPLWNTFSFYYCTSTGKTRDNYRNNYTWISPARNNSRNYTIINSLSMKIIKKWNYWSTTTKICNSIDKISTVYVRHKKWLMQSSISAIIHKPWILRHCALVSNTVKLERNYLFNTIPINKLKITKISYKFFYSIF